MAIVNGERRSKRVKQVSSERVTPNPTLEPTRTGMALGPLPGVAHHPSSGPSARGSAHTLDINAPGASSLLTGFFGPSAGSCIASFCTASFAHFLEHAPLRSRQPNWSFNRRRPAGSA